MIEERGFGIDKGKSAKEMEIFLKKKMYPFHVCAYRFFLSDGKVIEVRYLACKSCLVND